MLRKEEKMKRERGEKGLVGWVSELEERKRE